MSGPRRVGSGYSFRARLTAGLLAGAVLPLTGFGLVLLAIETSRTGGLDSTLGALVLFGLAAAIVFAAVLAYLLTGSLDRKSVV